MADPDDEKRKLLLPGKSNLSAPLPGLAFRIVGDPGRLEWEPDPVDGIRADDVVAPKESKEAKRGPEPTSRDAAAEWLAELLKDGPLPVAEIREQAKAADLSWGTIRRAQHSLGIVPHKMAFGSGWVWGLPEDAQVSSKMLKFPRRCSSNEKLEHLRENAGKKGQNCLDFAEDAQVSRNLSTFGENLSTFEETWPPSRITGTADDAESDAPAGTAGDAESDAPAGTADDAESDAPADPDLMPMRPDDAKTDQIAKLQEPGNLGLAADDPDGEHPEPPTLLQADRRQKPTEVSNEDGVEPGTPSATEADDPPQESLFDRYRHQMLPD
jgi:hypothetical protein